MLGDEGKGGLAGCTRKSYFRSASWTDRSPSKPNPNRNLLPNNRARPCLPPLQPLSISRRNVEEWPRAGSDDLGIWPHPQTPRETVQTSQNTESSSEPGRDQFQFKKDKLAFFDKECSKIVDHIYLGSDSVAKNREVLRQTGITHVLNCVGFVCPEYFKNEFVYKTLWLRDSPSEDITSILYDVFDYFEDVREQGGRVFVHCCQGVSRSTSLVIAYLMWKEAQSFHDAFQYVKAARGVTNPNLGFACQLLQCQKRVHAVPASPNSTLRIFRMAPHSPYDPLHLVPKMLNNPSVQGLDSRGAFLVHVPSAIYIWVGENCNSLMLDMAKTAASQVIRYERAKGPILSIKEGDEPQEFWAAIMSGKNPVDNSDYGIVEKLDLLSTGAGEGKVATLQNVQVGGRRVEEYDSDFEVFHKAVSGGVVPPFEMSNTESENCLPARKDGWSTIKRSFSFSNEMTEDIAISPSEPLDPDTTSPLDDMDMTTKIHEDTDVPVSSIDLASPPLSPTAYLCRSPDSLDCFTNRSMDQETDTSSKDEQTVLDPPLLSPIYHPGSPDSFSCFQGTSPKFGAKSPSLSPSTSDNSSSFTFSPSSSNWSDLSYFSSRQPSPSDFDSMNRSVENPSIIDDFCLHHKGTYRSFVEPFASYPTEYKNLTTRGASPSIAERRGSNPPPLMLLPSIEEPCKVQKKLVRSMSFSLPDLEHDVLEICESDQYKDESSSEDMKMDVDSIDASIELECEFTEVKSSVFYRWPSMDKVGINQFGNLDSRSAYMLFIPDVNMKSNSSDILFIWLGREVLLEKDKRQLISDDHGRLQLHWEMIGHAFINHMRISRDSQIKIISEGDEPEEFLVHLSRSLPETTEDNNR